MSNFWDKIFQLQSPSRPQNYQTSILMWMKYIGVLTSDKKQNENKNDFKPVAVFHFALLPNLKMSSAAAWSSA